MDQITNFKAEIVFPRKHSNTSRVNNSIHVKCNVENCPNLNKKHNIYFLE